MLIHPSLVLTRNLLLSASLAAALSSVVSSTAHAGPLAPGVEGPTLPAMVNAKAEDGVARFALVIGSNETASKDQKALRFADDDAARVAELWSESGAQVELLTVFDQSSQARFPDLVEDANQPTRKALDRAWARLVRGMDEAVAAGREVELTIYYAGHGDVGPDGQGFLTLAAGDSLTRSDLFSGLIANSPADRNHVIIDACRSEQFVLSRGDWKDDRGPANYNESVREYLDGNHLGAHPNTGVVLAHSVDQQTHEWERWQGGIFTHELLSGLRGGADLNGDGAIEYSELGAFVSAANSGVADPRARLEIAVHPPRGHERAPLLTHEGIEDERVLLLAGAAAGRYSVEDSRGVRLADIHHAPGQPAYLRLPEGPIYVYRHDAAGLRVGEASLAASSTGIVDLIALDFEEPKSTARGSLDDALREGLFEVEYGRGYYTGYTDHENLLAVSEPDWEVRVWQRDPETGEMVEVARVQGEGDAPQPQIDEDDDFDEVVITEVEIEDDCHYCWDATWLSFGAGAEWTPFNPGGVVRHPEGRVIANRFRGFNDKGFPSALRGVDVRMGAFDGSRPTDYPFAEGFFRTGYTEGHMSFLPADDAAGFGVGNATQLSYITVPLFFGGNFYVPEDWPVRPYFGFGAGLDVLHLTYARFEDDDLVDLSLRPGFELHAGVDVRITNYVILYGEVRQLWSAKRRLSKVPDFSNTGFTISTGIRFGVPVGRGASANGQRTPTRRTHTVRTIERKKKAEPAPQPVQIVVPPTPPAAPGAAPAAPAAAPVAPPAPAPIVPQPIEPSVAPEPTAEPSPEPTPEPAPSVELAEPTP